MLRTPSAISMIYYAGVTTHLRGVTGHPYGGITHLRDVTGHLHGGITHPHGAADHPYGVGYPPTSGRIRRCEARDRRIKKSLKSHQYFSQKCLVYSIIIC
jgi:hypothetical protein